MSALRTARAAVTGGRNASTASPAKASAVGERAEAGAEALLIRNLRVSFTSRSGTVDVVQGLDLTLRSGLVTVLLGESGSGKSVTARAVLRLLEANARVSGSIRLGGTELTELPEGRMREIRGGAVGLVSQDPSGSLDPLRRIGDQLDETLLIHRVEPDQRRARVHAAELLEQVGLPDPKRVLKALPFELSGGMRQRVAIAMAIGCRPRVLIADEPTTALDVTIQAQVLDLFTSLKREFRIAILLVTHDVGVARVIGDDVAVMYAGRLVERGTADRVLGEPRHPYTAALLGALPMPGIARGELQAIPGQPPSPGERPWDNACAFAARCGHEVAACRTHQPKLVELLDGQWSACDVIADRPIPTGVGTSVVDR